MKLDSARFVKNQIEETGEIELSPTELETVCGGFCPGSNGFPEGGFPYGCSGDGNGGFPYQGGDPNYGGGFPYGYSGDGNGGFPYGYSGGCNQ